MDYQASPTLATGDVQISKDGGAFTNITTLPVVTPAAGTSVQVNLSATEMQAARIAVRFIDQTSPKEWEDQEIIIETFGHASGQFLFNLAAANASGSGATAKTIKVQNGSGVVIVGTQVWLTTDIAGANVVGGPLTTDDSGEVTFYVDVGSTYYIWCDSADADFTNPAIWLVT
jgi:hypothetical protein